MPSFFKMGIDLGKHTFHVFGVDESDSTVVKQRTALANQIRGRLGEYGIVVAKGISKRGDKYIRTRLIHEARSVINRIEGKADRRSRWLQSRVARRGKNKAAVALANKNVRIIWALLSRGQCYRPAV